jgi:hypothetical protein
LITVHRPTEAECQRTIVAAAKLGGWLVYHNRPAQAGSGRWTTPLQGHAGFPDLILVHAEMRRILFVELKRHPAKVKPEQLAWGTALTAAGADWRVIWVPEQQDEFCQYLAEAATAPRSHVRTVARSQPALFDWSAQR